MESQIQPTEHASYSQVQIPIKALAQKEERQVDTILKEVTSTSNKEPYTCKSTSEKKFERLQNKAKSGLVNAIYASQDNI